MFTKLKKKIVEEDHSDLGSSLASSPPPSCRSRSISKENKWHKRRMSCASSYYGSRESIFTEPGFMYRDTSFLNDKETRSVRSSDAVVSPRVLKTFPLDLLYFTVYSVKSRKDFLSVVNILWADVMCNKRTKKSMHLFMISCTDMVAFFDSKKLVLQFLFAN